MLANKTVIGTVAPMLALPSTLTEFTWSMIELVEHNCNYVCGPDQKINYIKPGHGYHKLARNELAKRMEGDWLLMLDTDHQFEPDLLFRLLRVMYNLEVDVVTGLYLHRGHPYSPVLWKFDENGKAKTYHDWPEGEVLKVDCAGAGCLLVRRRVFERIRAELGEEPFDTHQAEWGQGGIVGEDFAFFRRLHRLGITAVCPTYIECHHLIAKPLGYAADYDAASVASVEVSNKAIGRK